MENFTELYYLEMTVQEKQNNGTFDLEMTAKGNLEMLGDFVFCVEMKLTHKQTAIQPLTVYPIVLLFVKLDLTAP